MPQDNSQQPVSALTRFLLGVYLAAITIGLSYFTAKIWPAVPAPPPSAQAPPPGAANADKGAGKAPPAADNAGTAQNQTKAPDGKTKDSKPGQQAASTVSDQKTGDNKGKDPGKAEDKQSKPAAAETKANPLPAGDVDQQVNKRPVELFWGMIKFFMTSEIRLILLVLAVGALGGCIHAATSFVGYVGNDKFYKTWVWYYVLRAPISAALALITYFVVRGGFFTATAGGSTAPVNDFGIAAVSGLVGMFSKQATAKLDEIFTSLFRTEKPGDLGDKLANKLPGLVSASPPTIAHGSADTTITLTGDGFMNKSEVRWAGVKLASTFVSGTQLTAIVPAAKLTAPGVFDVTVFSPAPGGGTSPAVKVTVN